MKFSQIILLFVASTCLMVACQQNESKPFTEIQTWLTTADKGSLLELQKEMISFSQNSSNGPIITIDTTEKFQSIDGFGYTLTGGSAQLINSLSDKKKDSLLHQLFSTEENGIGISYLRVSIGASDLDDHVFSYDDLPAGQTDPDLEKFSLKEDQKNLIPVLKKIVSIYPEIKIMGSPWSAPAWMKSNQSPKGGLLKREFYYSYAQYLAKYVQSMKLEGIVIDAITLQNEPEHPGNNPSMLMTAGEQADFIRENVGPAFRDAGISTKIILFDHNCDKSRYWMT